jgi:hypothetical protein
LIKKVVYKLHETFAVPVVEVIEPPFRLTEIGWGLFKVHAEVHLQDGRVLLLEHELCFDRPEQFRSILLQLQPPPLVFPDCAKAESEQAVVRSTFLFTDGIANVGIQKSEQLCDCIAAMSNELGSKQCTISTFGFGADHSEELLRNIAKTGNGVYCFIEGTDTIGEAFGEALGGLLSVTHQNVRLNLELAPHVKLVKARTAYPVEGPTRNENGWDMVSIDVSDLFAEERRDILLEFSLPESAEETHQHFGRFHARGFSVLGACSETTPSIDLVIERLSNASTDRSQAHPQVERHRNRYIASEALDSARGAGRRGNLGEARKTLQVAIVELTASKLATQGCSMTAALLVDLQECLADIRDNLSYQNSGSKKMAYMQMGHEMQRTCGGNTSAMYCNNFAFSMKSEASEALR